MEYNTKPDGKENPNETDEYIVNKLIKMYDEGKNIGPNLERYVRLNGNSLDKKIYHFNFGGNPKSGWKGSDFYCLYLEGNKLIQYEKLEDGSFEKSSSSRPVRFYNE